MNLACGVFGFPLGHSISAIFQQAAFDFERLDVTYHAWPVSPVEFPARLLELRESRFLGANVTIPHKETALTFVDYVDPIAAAVGAVNTVVRKGRELRGYNTDVPGFLDFLGRDVGGSPAGGSALLLGSGGAARAVGLGLVLAGAGRLVVTNRSPDRAHQLCEHLASVSQSAIEALRASLAPHLLSFGGVSESSSCTNTARAATPIVEVVAWHGDAFREAVRTCRLVVNCTSLGMFGAHQDVSPLPADVALHPDAVVVDIVANPLRTRLLAEVEEAGRRAVGGLPMLVYQGATSFTLWTGRAAPLDVMREAAIAHMRGLAP